MNDTASRPRLAVDIGGTFTDIAIEQGEEITTSKTLTTHGDPVEAVMRGIGLALEGRDLDPADFASVIHGTTLATNALIERRGANVAVLTTEGFRDILEIGYERRHDQYDINIDAPDYLVRRDKVLGVPERIGADGAILRPIDESAARAAISAALRDGADSLAICLLHSYANPTHEQRLAELAAEIAPDLTISLSSEVSPEIREFDRLCTTICNAYIKPLMGRYLRSLEAALRDHGFDCPLYIVTSGGGMTTLETAIAFPIRLVESGPSGGAIMAARVAAERQLDKVVSFDMGGTTAKICLIDDQTPKTSRAFEIDRSARFTKGSGIPVRIPVIEMIEIGAGGGSVAWTDPMGRLRIGPVSASSDPGPAAYGRGGTEPTVTDADVAMGFIAPQGFAENRIHLNPAKAARAIDEGVGATLGLTTVGAANAISQSVDEAMANAARVHAVEHGKDLSDYTMVAFGGNGPLHAARIAEKTGVNRILVPPNPSVGSAVGFLNAPMAYELVRTRTVTRADFAFDAVNAMLDEMTAQATAIVAVATDARVSVRRVGLMRYQGQGQEIEIALPEGALDHAALARMAADFDREYADQYSRTVPGMEIEFVNWSVTAEAMGRAAESVAHATTTRRPAPDGARQLVHGDDVEAITANVFDRESLDPGDTLSGPALITEPQTTTYVPAGFDAEIDGGFGIVLTRRTSRAEASHKAQSEMQLQVMWDRLLSVVEEQAQVLMRTAFSPIVRECGDISAGVFDPSGEMLAQAVTGTPGHINTMAGTVAAMLPHIDIGALRPGDVWCTNDPWIGAGHLNDIALVAPIFHDGDLIAFTACTSHLYDVGGRGMGPDGADVYDEGLFVPVCKLVDQGQVNRLVIDFIKANSRTPVANEGDVYALIACCDVAARRVAEMMGGFGLSDLSHLARHILTTSRTATEAAISALPQGTFESALTIDGYDFPIELKAALSVDGSRIVVDMAGSSGPSALGVNCPISYAAAYGTFALRCLVGPHVPNNAGSLEPFEFRAPEGSIVNAVSPAPVAMRHTTGQMVADLVFGALHQADPDLPPAEGASCLWDIPIRSDPSAAMPGSCRTVFATEFTHSGGTGARPGKDGLSATAFPSGVYGTQTEIAETIAPILYLRRELIADSGGAGTFRGGLGQRIDVQSSEGVDMLLLAGVERTQFPAQGRAGGSAGRAGRITLSTGAVLRSKGEQTIPAGTTLIWESPGGAGHGAPHKRDPESVARDYREDLVSLDAARRLYRVGLTPDGQVDPEATETLRQT